MKQSLHRVITVAVCLPLLLGVRVSAQQLATLNVFVTDPSGSAIAQARITVRNEDTRAKRTEVSSATGIAVIPGLNAGSYQLTVESDQFSPFQATLVLSVGQNASVPVTRALRGSSTNSFQYSESDRSFGQDVWGRFLGTTFSSSSRSNL